MKKIENRVEFVNPEGLHKNPAFSQVVTVTGHTKTIYVGGQNAIDKEGNIVGKGNIGAQATQVLRNIETALAADGATLDHVIKWSVYALKGQPLEPAFQVFQSAMSKLKNAPLITIAYVAGLANEDYLMEMEAVAVIPEK